MHTRESERGISIMAILMAIAVVAAAGSAIVYSMKKSAPPKEESQVPTITATPTKDTSDTAIDQEISGEDEKLNELDTDSKNVDQGLNDKQGDLSE